MNLLKQKLAIASCLAVVPFAVCADQVTLTSPDGQTTITGDLLSFDDETISLDTNIGEVRVPRALIICEGDACPEPADGFNLFVAANGSDTTGLAQDFAIGFASA